MEILYPSVRHLLTVSYREDETDTVGVYATLPVDEHVRIIDHGKSEKSKTEVLRSQQTLIAKEPIVIAKPEMRDNQVIIKVLLLLLQYSDPLPSYVELPKPELRRNIIDDVQSILRKAKNNRLSEEKLIQTLIKLNVFYVGRPTESFQGVLEELVHFGHIKATKAAKPKVYYL